MRQFSPTTVFAAVSLALCAHASFAQVNAGRATAGPSASAPANRAGLTTSTSSTGTTVTFTNPNSLANSGQSNQSGSSGQTVTAIVGTQGGFTTFNVPAAANGSVATAGTNAAQGQVSSLQGAQLVDTQGRAFTDANGNALTLDARGVVGVAPGGFGNDAGIVTGTPEQGGNVQQVMVVNPATSAGSVTLTPELDRATRKELNKAKVASRSRNKQLLYTIAPRTSVDRTSEMPDDPVSPALSTPERAIPRY